MLSLEDHNDFVLNDHVCSVRLDSFHFWYKFEKAMCSKENDRDFSTK